MLVVQFRKDCLAMTVNNKISALGMPLLCHSLLMASIVLDFFRRNNYGISLIVLSAICLMSLLIGGVFFARHPRLFFFMLESSASFRYSPSIIARLFSWAFVVFVPVLWLILGIDLLPNAISSELLRRIVGSYVFFSYIAATIIVSPFLFSQRNS